MDAVFAEQNCQFNPDADQGSNARNLNHELIIYMHSMCQEMLNTAMHIDIAAYASKNQHVGLILFSITSRLIDSAV